jgi:hypothetical protein
VALAEPTDGLDLQAGAHVALASVLAVAGRAEERARLLAAAVELYGRKENGVLARRTRVLLQSASTQAV